MKSVLEADWQPVLDELARSDVLVALDFDGTLAPIVDHPPDAVMRSSTRALLRLLALLYPTVVISGRSRQDLLPRLSRIPLVATVGGHGAEPGFGPIDAALRRRVNAWCEWMRHAVGALDGVVVEDNGSSVSVHYRHAPSWSRARRAITEVAVTLPGARLVPGRAVVTVAPVEAPDKGAALEALLARTGRSKAIFVGDDRTDEDAFRARGVVLGVRVGRTHRTAALAYLPSQAAVDDLLRALVRARRRVHGLDGDTMGLERLLALP